MITGVLHRTDQADRLIGSIELDCTPLRATVASTNPFTADDQSLRDSTDPGLPQPVDAVWDELEGWSVGLRHSSGLLSRRYLHPDVLPDAAAVGEFVVGLARGATLGAAHPIASAQSGHPHLRLMQVRVAHNLRVWMDHTQPGTVDLISPAAQACRPGGSSSTPTGAPPK